MGQSSMTDTTSAPGAESPEVVTEVKAEVAIQQDQPQAETPAGDEQPADPEAKAKETEQEKKEPTQGELRRKERNKQRWQEMKQRLSYAEAELKRMKSAPPPDFSQFVDPNEELAERTAHRVRESFAQDREAELNRTRQETEAAMWSAWEEQVADARQRMPDFDQVFSDRVPVHPRAAPFLADSDQGADIAYYLGKNPEAAERLYRDFESNPARALMHLGRIEAEISRPRAKSTSTAPKPAAVLSGGSNPPAFDPSKSSVADMAAALKKAGVLR